MVTRTLHAFVLAVLTPCVSAQMAGTYTVDPAGTGSRNYKDVQSAIIDLWRNGMSGPVQLDLAAVEFRESVSIIPIAGMSTTNTLTIKGKPNWASVIRSVARADCISFDFSTATNPISGLIFDGVQVADNAIRAYTPVTDLEIKNCNISSIVGAAVRWHIHHSRMGIGVDLSDCDDVSIHHNDIRTLWAAIVIQSTSLAATAKPVRIYNNVITGRSNDRPIVEFARDAYGVEFVHNSILSTGSTYDSCLGMWGHFTRPHLILNNIIAITDYHILELDSIRPYNYVMDGNLYYAPKGSVCYINTASNYQTLTSWQLASGLDKNSASGDPQFEGGLTTPGNLALKPTSPAIGLARNTPAYVTDDYAGNPRGNRVDAGAFQAQLPFTVFGVGCPGTLGNTPVLSSTGTPRIGSQDFSIHLTNALGSNGGPAWLVIGASSKSWGAIPLPLRFGGTCDLLVSADILLQVGTSGIGPGKGTADVKIAIPNDPKLIGTRTYFQWGAPDPAAKGIGVAFSNAGYLAL